MGNTFNIWKKIPKKYEYEYQEKKNGSNSCFTPSLVVTIQIGFLQDLQQ
jgi:hypothetical protein